MVPRIMSLAERERTLPVPVADLLRRILAPERPWLVLAIVHGIGIGLLTLAVPVSVQMLIDTVANTARLQPVIVLAVALFVLLLLSGLLTGLRTWLMELYGRRLYARLTAEIALRSVHAESDFFDRQERAGLINRYFDIMTLQKRVPFVLTGGFAIVFQAAIGFTLVSFYHPALLAFNLALIALLALIWAIWGRRAVRTGIERSHAKYATADWLETIAAAGKTRLHERDRQHALLKTDRLTGAYIDASIAHFAPGFAQSLSLLLLYGLASAALLGLGGWLVIAGQLSLGQLVAAELILSAIFVGFARLGVYLDAFYEIVAACDELDLIHAIPVKATTIGTSADGDVPVDDVMTSDPVPFPDRDREVFRTLRAMAVPRPVRTVAFMLGAFLVAVALFLVFVPWVQTTAGPGTVTTLDPRDRMQRITSLVEGRIKTWYVREGSRVRAGDPIALLVDNDPRLVERLEGERAAVARQLDAIRTAVETARIDLGRQTRLHERGLAARVELEKARLAVEELEGRKAAVEAELERVEVNLSRQSNQLVTAPRDGTVLRILASDLATLVQAGEPIATFIPADVEKVVELRIAGRDIPLVTPGRKVRLQFEGWPAVQFSGWPSAAVGTFGGEVLFVEPTVSPDGSFRVLVGEDPEDVAWPEEQYTRLGSRAEGWILLDTVSIGFELWRRLNTFPPNRVVPPAETDGNVPS